MDKKKAVYVPTVGEEIGNAVSHGVMSLLSLLALPFAAVWAYAHDPGGVLASVSVSVFVISISVTFPFQTIKGAVRYSDEGLENWASKVEKLSVVSALLPLQPVVPRDRIPPATVYIKFLIIRCVFMVLIVKRPLLQK